jgi:hypothetical protein
MSIGFFILGIFSFSLFGDLLKPNPYNYIEVLSVDWTDNSVYLVATFIKNGKCELVSFAPVGFSLGIPEYLQFKDGQGLPSNFDREAGKQLLNIQIDLSNRSYEYIEIRTRHKCVGVEESITKVFTTLKR